MLPTILFVTVLGAIVGALLVPVDARRVIAGALAGLVLGGVLAFFNVYVGSVRGVLVVLALTAAIVAGIGNLTRYHRPREAGAMVTGGVGTALFLGAILLVTGLVPFTAWGASTQDETVYSGLQGRAEEGSAPVLAGPEDLRVVPWSVASELLVRGYGSDASWLDTSPRVLLANTWPDTVRGEFLWVNAPQPEGAKWFAGGRHADKVLYVKNDPTDLTPTVVNATLAVHRDGIWWQDRVARHALNAAEFKWQVTDTALQLDDEDNPYWIAYLARIDLRGQPHLEKLLVIDAVTGEDALVDPGDAPEWLEVVYPENYVYAWTSYWGQHREGVLYRVFDAQGLLVPDDVSVRYVRLGNDTYWLMPMRQLASPQLGGYVLVDTRTGDATFYDRFDKALVDYGTAVEQLAAIMASGEATRGQGQIRLRISEGYLYPVEMEDGSVRDAYVFPLLEGLKVSRIAVIDAADYTNRRVFAGSVKDALETFAAGSTSAGNATNTASFTARVLDGAVYADRILVNLNGTLYRVEQEHLAGGSRAEPEREFDELAYAVERANRGEEVLLDVRVRATRVVDVSDSGVTWGG